MMSLSDVVVVLSAMWLCQNAVLGVYFRRELSSVKGVCDAQCEALCIDEVAGCERKCSRNVTREWMFNCQNGGKCTVPGYCSVLKNESLPSLPGFYIPPKPVVRISRNPSTRNILLKWSMDQSTNNSIIYIVQWNKSNKTIYDETLWFTLGWTKWGRYLVEEEPDPCQRPWFRVAAVSRYGSLWYTDPAPTPLLDVGRYPPGKVRNISYSDVYYNNLTEEVNFSLYWSEPENWDRSDISGYMCHHTLHRPCLDTMYAGPIGDLVYYDPVSSANDSKVHIRMPKIAIGCKFNFQVTAFSKCKHDTPGTISSIDVTIDCHSVKGYQCEPSVYQPPGNPENITLVFLPNGSLLVKWLPPSDMGTAHSIEMYHVRWGKVNLSDLIPTLYNYTTITVDGNTTCAVITVPNYTANQTDRYGVQIIATPPGHSQVSKGSWIPPVTPQMSDDVVLDNPWPKEPAGYTPILRDDNGVVIVVVPKVKGVRVYVTMPETRSNVDVIGFYVSWGGLNNISNELSISKRRNVFIDKMHPRPR